MSFNNCLHCTARHGQLSLVTQVMNYVVDSILRLKLLVLSDQVTQVMLLMPSCH